jgi:hypothetical protein
MPPGSLRPVSIFLLVFLITLSRLFLGILAPGGNFYTSLTALRAAKGRRSPPAENSNVFTRPAPIPAAA